MPRADDSDHPDDHTELMALAVRLARGAGSLTVRLRADGRADGRGDGRRTAAGTAALMAARTAARWASP